MDVSLVFVAGGTASVVGTSLALHVRPPAWSVVEAAESTCLVRVLVEFISVGAGGVRVHANPDIVIENVVWVQAL